MRTFSCPHCAQPVVFENSECLRCGSPIGFDPTTSDMAEVVDGGLRRCANDLLAACNWLVAPDDPVELCRSCRLTRTRPADDDAAGVAELGRAEAAKRRLLYQLLDLGLPFEADDLGRRAVGFDLLSSASTKVVTGHDDGLITLDLSESDDVHREQVRRELDEPYRTVLGHFRHEIGHYYWPVLVAADGLDQERLDAARALFGDETADYGDAVDRHYSDGPPAGWEDRHVSAYATMHPFEDWAETFAHYLHIRDTIDTADAYGLRVEGPADGDLPAFALGADEVADEPFSAVVSQWLGLVYALNALSRSMGRDDAYPFVLPPAVIDKLSFVHRVVTSPAPV